LIEIVKHQTQLELHPGLRLFDLLSDVSPDAVLGQICRLQDLDKPVQRLLRAFKHAGDKLALAISSEGRKALQRGMESRFERDCDAWIFGWHRCIIRPFVMHRKHP
jgi:hypothetical protein